MFWILTTENLHFHPTLYVLVYKFISKVLKVHTCSSTQKLRLCHQLPVPTPMLVFKTMTWFWIPGRDMEECLRKRWTQSMYYSPKLILFFWIYPNFSLALFSYGGNQYCKWSSQSQTFSTVYTPLLLLASNKRNGECHLFWMTNQ